MSWGTRWTRKVPRASIRYSAGNGKAESLTEDSPSGIMLALCGGLEERQLGPVF